jgi:hypothetical protein
MQMILPGEYLQFLFKKIFKLQCLLLFAVIYIPQELFSQGYFQQQVNYEIKVSLNDVRHELSGFESIEYINNSPDTLSFLYFHLWPNAYSANNTSLAIELMKRDGKSKLFRDQETRGYIDSLEFECDGNALIWSSLEGYPDICKIILNKPLIPGGSIRISTPFHVKIPTGGISRLGHVYQSYQISQWYPKPAVYDKSGWHQMPYLDQGEFYSEYGNFDVTITLPSNYVVGSTGNLQNPEELEWLDRKAADTTWMMIPYFRPERFPPSSSSTKTLRYTGKNIHDFAWFADKRFRVLKGHVVLPESGKNVTTLSMFPVDQGYLWKNSISYINNAIKYFSEWNGDYPYDSFTAVQSALSAGDGMEYPALTVISAVDDSYLLDDVLAHEICHNWFYSALGSDERRYPFMDESITSSYEARYMAKQYPDKKLWEITLRNRKLAKIFHSDKIPADRIDEISWIVPARLNQEQILNLSAPDYTFDNYGSMIYSKAARGFTYLRSFLGDPLFDSIMHDYYRNWQNKHPGPDDLRKIFESHTDKDLTWFFDDFLGTTKRLDYKAVKYDNGRVLVKNKGQLKAPFVVAEMKKDTVISEKWYDGFKGRKWLEAAPADYSSIKIDPDHKMTELYRLNNNIKTTGIFPKSDPLDLQFLYTLEDPEKRYLVWFPVLNWNHLNGFMLGVALQNGTVIPKKFQYFLLPFLTIKDRGLTGYGKVSLNSIPYNSFIRMASFSLEMVQFSAPGDQNWHKIKTGVDLYIKQADPNRNLNQKFYSYFIAASDLISLEEGAPAKTLGFFQTGYVLEKTGFLNPFLLGAAFEAGSRYQKISLDVNYKYSYSGKKNGLDMRFYLGTMLHSNNPEPFYEISPGGRKGPEEYLYQDVYPDRFSKFPETFFSRQMTMSE